MSDCIQYGSGMCVETRRGGGGCFNKHDGPLAALACTTG